MFCNAYSRGSHNEDNLLPLLHMKFSQNDLSGSGDDVTIHSEINVNEVTYLDCSSFS